ncbi:MAG: cupin domain-containing protein [Vicinamibacteria bacterium]
MARVSVPTQGRTIEADAEVAAFLAAAGLEYERWRIDRAEASAWSADDALRAFEPEVEALKARGGYTVADVIDVRPGLPGLEAMLERFAREHWHDEDEIRFVIEGRGVFHVRPETGPVFAIEVGPGDLIRVPRGTKHWFDLCAERRIRAIRLFQDPAGWTPHYTESGVDRQHLPMCLGPESLPVGA